MSAFVLSFVAGNLASLSPCVLPTLPLVVGSASQKHRYGPIAVATGMVLSFTGLGLLLSASGNFVSASDWIRPGASVLLILSGVLLVSGYLQRKFEVASEPITGFAGKIIDRFSPDGLKGQFLVGTLLGAIWAPCTGPTLGAAIGLAAQSSTRGAAGLMMFLFGVGTTVPLLLVAYGSRYFTSRSSILKRIGSPGKTVFGILLIGFGTVSLLGIDKQLEAFLLRLMPTWLLQVLTSL